MPTLRGCARAAVRLPRLSWLSWVPRSLTRLLACCHMHEAGGGRHRALRRSAYSTSLTSTSSSLGAKFKIQFLKFSENGYLFFQLDPRNLRHRGRPKWTESCGKFWPRCRRLPPQISRVTEYNKTFYLVLRGKWRQGYDWKLGAFFFFFSNERSKISQIDWFPRMK